MAATLVPASCLLAALGSCPDFPGWWTMSCKMKLTISSPDWLGPSVHCSSRSPDRGPCFVLCFSRALFSPIHCVFIAISLVCFTDGKFPKSRLVSFGARAFNFYFICFYFASVRSLRMCSGLAGRSCLVPILPLLLTLAFQTGSQLVPASLMMTFVASNSWSSCGLPSTGITHVIHM